MRQQIIKNRKWYDSYERLQSILTNNSGTINKIIIMSPSRIDKDINSRLYKNLQREDDVRIFTSSNSYKKIHFCNRKRERENESLFLYTKDIDHFFNKKKTIPVYK